MIYIYKNGKYINQFYLKQSPNEDKGKTFWGSWINGNYIFEFYTLKEMLGIFGCL